MKHFKCLIRGDDFPGILIGADCDVGFYTTRFVDCDSAEAAEPLSLKSLRDDPKLVGGRFADLDLTRSRIYVEEIEECAMCSIDMASGFSWFPMTQSIR